MGKILNNVKKLKTDDSEYEVRTPTAAAAVRGTVYEVEYDLETGKTSVKVLEGLIDLESRLGARLTQRLNELEKIGIDSTGNFAPVEALSEGEKETMKESSDNLGATQTGSTEGQTEQMGNLDNIQSNMAERMDAIQDRANDENRLTVLINSRMMKMMMISLSPPEIFNRGSTGNKVTTVGNIISGFPLKPCGNDSKLSREE